MLKRIVGAFAVMATCFAAHADDCQLKRLAALDMKVGTGGRIEVPAVIGGQPSSLIVDTGSGYSMIAERTADALGLKKFLFPNSAIWAWGGARLTSYVVVDGFQLGNLTVGRSQMLIIPNQYMSVGSDGLLGSDLMSRFDADFDFANGKLNFISKEHCRGKVVYWTDEANVAVVPFHRSPTSAEFMGRDFRKILLMVTIDGKEFHAELDTGAHATAMNLSAARSAFGLTPESPGMVPIKHAGGTAYRYRFKSLSFGGVAVANPEIILDPYEVNKMSSTGPAILVGMNVLRELHLYVAYTEEKLYISAATATK